MKKAIILFVTISASLITFAQTGKDKMPKSHKDSTKQVKYTCSMHPEVSSDKPGKCPKCGMDLVVKTMDKKGMGTHMHKMPMNKMDSTTAKKKMKS